MADRQADENAKELTRIADKLFSKRYTLMTLWQTLAEQCNPERADFTRPMIEGEEFGVHLFESAPVRYRRDLANNLGAILRPEEERWFNPKPRDKSRETDNAKRWLSQQAEVLRSSIYAPLANFSVALQQGDDDFVTFGNAVHAITENETRSGFLFESYHLRDCVWQDDRNGEANWIARKLKMTLRQKVERWGLDCLSEAQKKTYEKDPHEEIEVRHCVMPSDMYSPYRTDKTKKFRLNKGFASIYYCPIQNWILSEGSYYEFPYLIRRWRRRSNSQYAFSPAAMHGLIDSRLLQSQAEVILEAGERVVDPPKMAYKDSIIGGLNTMAGETTWLDGDHDEKQHGAPIRQLEVGGNIPLGLEMKQDTRMQLADAWFVNKLTLPQDKDMTAYETRERIAEYIRTNGPLFRPILADNAKLLDTCFMMLMRFTANANRAGEPGPFGWIEDVPEELQGEDITYEFSTPLQMAYERQKAAKAREGVEGVALMVQATGDVALWDHIEKDRVVRDGWTASTGEPNWMMPLDDVQAIRDQRAERERMMQAAAESQQNLDAIPKVAAAAGALQQMGQAMLPPPEREGEAMMDLAGEGEEEQPMPAGGMPQMPEGAALSQPIWSTDQYAQFEDVPDEDDERPATPLRRQRAPAQRERGGKSGGDMSAIKTALETQTAALAKLIETMNAPKRVIRDESGKAIGMETVR